MTIPAPRSSDDTYDLIDDALCVLAERHGDWLGDRRRSPQTIDTRTIRRHRRRDFARSADHDQ
jgi:hypothetical protein